MIYRVIFEKGEDIRYISHLDLIRTFNRMLYRSELPIKHSEGFNPHICLNFALPLPVGATSKRDYAEIELTEEKNLEDIKNALIKAAPGGIKINEISTCLKPSFKEVAKAEFRICFYGINGAEKITKFLQREEIITSKKSKRGIKDVDIRPMIFEYSVLEQNGNTYLEIVLSAGNTVNLNPFLLIKTMEKETEDFFCEEVEVLRMSLMTENGRKI